MWSIRFCEQELGNLRIDPIFSSGMATPYTILGVTPQATQDEIKEAYRKLAKKNHPDLNPGNKEAEKRFKEISVAYEQIGTAEARAKFDQETQAEEQWKRAQAEGRGRRRGPFYSETQQGGGRYSQQFSGMNIDEDILASIFGQMGGANRGPMRGQDSLYQLDVDFKDSVLGAEREIHLPTGKKLKIKIPAGVESGTKLRLQGQGEPGEEGAPAGDAFVQLNVKPSETFKRVGNDLEIELPISVADAVLGGEVKAPTIDGNILLKIPPGVSSGQQLRVARKGVLNQNGERGDQRVTLKIILPKNIDPEFKEAVEAWRRRQTA